MPKKTTKTKESKVEAKPQREQVTVHFNGRSRVYSLANHGEEFEKLAEQFASQYVGSTIE